MSFLLDPLHLYTPDLLSELCDTANRVRLNADEVRLLYSPGAGVDASPMLQEELTRIGSGAGGVQLASGEWYFGSDLEEEPAYWSVFGAGKSTRVTLADGVNLFSLTSPASGRPTYEFGNMVIRRGRSFLRVNDPANLPGENRAAVGCRFSNLWLEDQTGAAFDLHNALYRPIFDHVHVMGDNTSTTHCIYVDSQYASAGILILGGSLGGATVAALGTSEASGIVTLLALECGISNNAGRVAQLWNSQNIQIIGGLWEDNCLTVQAEPVRMAEFFNCQGVAALGVQPVPDGAGGRDPNDDNHTTVFYTDNQLGHVFQGCPRGNVKIGGDAHAVYAGPDEWINLDSRKQYVLGPDGHWFPVGLSSALTVVPA